MCWREQKLRLMCSRPIRSPYVAWPREILYDELRRFVGILMPRADGVPLGAFAFHAELLKKQFPSWTRYDLTRLCLNLSESVHALHRCGVVLGDLHPGNVLVSPDGSICWVDAASFQIEDYPCSVGTERFRAPELRGNYGDFLRARSHDAYALSVLLFMTLALGLSPFARQGGEGDMREAAGKGILPYSFASYKPPAGFYPPDTPGRYVWSYLPRKLRDALGHNLTCVQRRDLR
ncbi:protein kinase domain-containing protein, partial [Akkermansia sp.]|uniref:protein kinase domain-containing protein n=4 Tax=Akkermansiaceae TaxID=1647988 RepID=UPI003991E529